MTRIITVFTFIITTLTAVCAESLNLNVTIPGTLYRLVGANTDASSLKVSGTIDVRDLDFICEKMTALRTLDLGATSIAAFEGERKLTRQLTFEEGELPALSLAGIKATAVTLPAGLVTIGDGALAGSAITSIAIPPSVRRIGAGAFAACNSMRAVTVPDGVRKLGPAIFRDCAILETVNFGATDIPDHAFAGCKALKTVKLAEKLATVGNSAFADCTALTTADFAGRPLTSIGSHAFRGCGLESLDLSGAIAWSSIGDWAFADCPNLRELWLPANVETLGRGAFFNDASLESLSAPNGITTVAEATFKGVSSLDNNGILGDRVVRIGRYAFYGNSAMTLIQFPATLSAIDTRAFDGCTSLAEMNAPAIAVVPELGDDVWGTLKKSEIILGVPAEMIPLFEATPVWQEFRIREAGIDDITTDGTGSGDGFNFTARFEGSLMLIDANSELTRVELYDTMGRMLTAIDCRDASIAIDTSRWSNRIFIVRATAGDSTAVCKTARN